MVEKNVPLGNNEALSVSQAQHLNLSRVFVGICSLNTHHPLASTLPYFCAYFWRSRHLLRRKCIILSDYKMLLVGKLCQ